MPTTSDRKGGPWAIGVALGLVAAVATGAGGCREETLRDRIDEAVEEIVDEAGDLKDEILDEIDDHT